MRKTPLWGGASWSASQPENLPPLIPPAGPSRLWDSSPTLIVALLPLLLDRSQQIFSNHPPVGVEATLIGNFRGWASVELFKKATEFYRAACTIAYGTSTQCAENKPRWLPLLQLAPATRHSQGQKGPSAEPA